MSTHQEIKGERQHEHKPHPVFSVNRYMQNVQNSLYLQTNCSMNSTPVTWTTSPKGSVIALSNPRDSAGSGPIYTYLSGDMRLNNVCTKSYCGSSELWIQTWDSVTATYTLANFRWNLYLACGTNGNLVLSSTLNNASRWIPYSSGGNSVFQNYATTTYFLRGNPDGVTVTGSPSLNPYTDNYCNWYIDNTRQILINNSTNILNSNNTVFETDTSYVQSMVFAMIPVGSYWALQTYFGGFLNANPDNTSIGEYPYTDPGKLPNSALWNLI